MTEVIKLLIEAYAPNPGEGASKVCQAFQDRLHTMSDLTDADYREACAAYVNRWKL